MTVWNPEWRVSVDGGDFEAVTIANLTITTGRTDFYSQPVAGYCRFQLINLDNTSYDFTINTQVAIEVKNSSGTYVPIFGGFISDFAISVQSSGRVGHTTIADITAMGALSKLPKIITDGVLAKDFEGDQIYDLLSDSLGGQWSDVSASQTWATYDAATTWALAEVVGLGDIDLPGQYEMVARSSSPINLYTLISEIAQSAFGYIYEDANGNIGYADTYHRKEYLQANGYVNLDANHALASGIKSVVKSGDIRNKITVAYGPSASSTYTSEDVASQSLYGISAQSSTSLLHNGADAISVADRYITLRSNPYPKFEAITFQLANPEIDDSDRDNLLGVFMGMPIQIDNLPLNIVNGLFQGFVEGWTFQAGYGSMSLTINATPYSYSDVATRWSGVSALETWNTLSGTMTWAQALGTVA